MTRCRPSGAGDVATLAEIFHDAVRIGAAPDYTEAERAAWSPARPDPAAFASRLEGQHVLVAQDRDGGIAGFVSLAPDGTLDMAFVRPGRQRQGIADCLYGRIEAHARAEGMTRLRAFASHLLRPLLLARGWSVVRAGRVRRNGVELENWLMEKDLGLAARRGQQNVK